MTSRTPCRSARGRRGGAPPTRVLHSDPPAVPLGPLPTAGDVTSGVDEELLHVVSQPLGRPSERQSLADAPEVDRVMAYLYSGMRAAAKPGPPRPGGPVEASPWGWSPAPRREGEATVVAETDEVAQHARVEATLRPLVGAMGLLYGEERGSGTSCH